MATITLDDLRQRVEAMELYGHRDDLLRALVAGDTTRAATLCREAMNDAADRARYNCAPIGPEGHRRNFDALRRLRSDIRSLQG